MQIFHNPNYDFLRWRWHAIALSWIIIIAGVGTILVKGMPLGIEFSGGTIVRVQFDKDPVPEPQQIRAALDRAVAGGGQNAIIQRFGDPSQRQVMIRVPDVGAESGGSLSQAAESVQNALKQANLGSFTTVGTE